MLATVWRQPVRATYSATSGATGTTERVINEKAANTQKIQPFVSGKTVPQTQAQHRFALFKGNIPAVSTLTPPAHRASSIRLAPAHHSTRHNTAMDSPRVKDELSDPTMRLTTAASPETALQSSPPSSRSSKRANSAVSVFERSKFRSRAEGYALYTTSPPPGDRLHDASSHLDNDDTNSITGSPQAPESGPRHYSASSVVNAHTFVGKSLLSPMAPQMEHLWASKTLSQDFPIKLIDQKLFKAITNWHYSNPLPECDLVFPWLHGIHHSNQNQKAFFACLADYTTVERNNFSAFENQSKIPSSSRGLMTVRSCPIRNDHDQMPYNEETGILKGSVEPDEILCPLDISKQDLHILLNNLLKDVKIDTLHPGRFEEILNTICEDSEHTGLLPIFLNMDPTKGISLRNFHIQVSKMAQISDFVVYCFNDDHFDSSCQGNCSCPAIARLLYLAQLKHGIDHPELVDPLFQTVILEHNDIEYYKKEGNEKLLIMDKLTVWESGRRNGNSCSKWDFECFKNWDSNFLLREKLEIAKMSSATPVLSNVWFGNYTDGDQGKFSSGPRPPRKQRRSSLPLYVDPSNSTVIVTRQELATGNEELLINKPTEDWGVLVNCCEGASFPTIDALECRLHFTGEHAVPIKLLFPPSGSVGIGDCTDSDLMSLINTCKLVYVKSKSQKPGLIYCADGYTESSLFGICYLIYATGKSFTEVSLDLHKRHGRPFFLFPTDVQLISRLESILRYCSPTNIDLEFNPNELQLVDNDIIYKNLFMSRDICWLTKLNASLPSRILPHLYLGSLNHANTFELLQELGIQNIVSVGESLSWLDDEEDATITEINPNITVLSNFKNSAVKKLMCVNNIQDDGIDMLTHNLNDILEFIDQVHESGEKVLVHCRVGVSRSATVCIAEVMKRLNVNLVKAYIYVRVRRLNIIIQPNLRFMYELVKWEEAQRLAKVKARMSKVSLVSGSGDHSLIGVKSLDLSKRMSESVSSMNSIISGDVTDIATHLQFLDAAGSPKLHNLDSAVLDDDDDLDEQNDYTEDDWLRDVDWHVLCREIDLLNRAYIRS